MLTKLGGGVKGTVLLFALLNGAYPITCCSLWSPRVSNYFFGISALICKGKRKMSFLTWFLSRFILPLLPMKGIPNSQGEHRGPSWPHLAPTYLLFHRLYHSTPKASCSQLFHFIQVLFWYLHFQVCWNLKPGNLLLWAGKSFPSLFTHFEAVPLTPLSPRSAVYVSLCSL